MKPLKMFLTRLFDPDGLQGMKKGKPNAEHKKLRKVAVNTPWHPRSRFAYYARFRHKGQRIVVVLSDRNSPCTSLPGAKRLRVGAMTRSRLAFVE